MTNASSPDLRRKRSTSQLSSTPTFNLGPRMLTVAVIKSSVPNLPPVVQDTTFTLLEDHGKYNFTLTYTDPEGDGMTFWLPQQPVHGTAYVTPDGKVTYLPHPNYNGVDEIYVKGESFVSNFDLFKNVVVPLEIFAMKNSGRFTQGKSAATESRYPASINY